MVKKNGGGNTRLGFSQGKGKKIRSPHERKRQGDSRRPGHYRKARSGPERKKKKGPGPEERKRECSLILLGGQETRDGREKSLLDAREKGAKRGG